MSTCPHCKNSFTHVNIKPVNGKSGRTTWDCISYNCPNRDASLSVAVDPVMLQDGILQSIQKLKST